MGLSKTGEVYRFDWITLVSQGHNLFKLVSNGGTEVKELKEDEAANVRDEVKDTLVCMSPQFGMTRSDKMNLPTSRVSLSVVAHMKKADISQDHSTAYKSSVIVPQCYIKEFPSLSNSENGLAYYKGCPHCKKATRNDDTCPDHGKVVPNQVVGAAVVIQDPCTTLEATLWKEPLEALRTQFAVGPDVPGMDVLQMLEQKTSACKLVARMAIGINKSGKAHYVDLFDLAPAVSAEGVLGAFHDSPALPGHGSDGLAPLCCQHLHRDEMGQLQAKFESQTRLIGGAMCMFRVRAEPEQYIVQDVDGLIVKVQAECCVCNQTVTLQQAGAPQSVQKMNRMRVDERALANVSGAKSVAFAAVNLSDVCALLRVRTGAPWLPSGPACRRAIDAGMQVWVQPGTLVRLVPRATEGATLVTFRVDRSMTPLAVADWVTHRVTYRADECWHTHDAPCTALGGWADEAYAIAHMCLAASLAAAVVSGGLQRQWSRRTAVVCVGVTAAAVAYALGCPLRSVSVGDTSRLVRMSLPLFLRVDTSDDAKMHSAMSREKTFADESPRRRVRIATFFQLKLPAVIALFRFALGHAKSRAIFVVRYTARFRKRVFRFNFRQMFSFSVENVREWQTQT